MLAISKWSKDSSHIIKEINWRQYWEADGDFFCCCKYFLGREAKKLTRYKLSFAIINFLRSLQRYLFRKKDQRSKEKNPVSLIRWDKTFVGLTKCSKQNETWLNQQKDFYNERDLSQMVKNWIILAESSLNERILWFAAHDPKNRWFDQDNFIDSTNFLSHTSVLLFCPCILNSWIITVRSRELCDIP